MQNNLYKISITDGLGFSSGFVSPASYTCMIFISLPASWIENGELPEDKQEKILQRMYGENWRNGNEDGSFFVVSQFLYEEVNASENPWEQYQNNNGFRCWFWEVKEGAIVEVKPEQFV